MHGSQKSYKDTWLALLYLPHDRWRARTRASHLVTRPPACERDLVTVHVWPLVVLPSLLSLGCRGPGAPVADAPTGLAARVETVAQISITNMEP
jgi:hypothetical protein